MKKIFATITLALVVFTAAFAQDTQAKPSVQIGVYFDETSDIPVTARTSLANKIRSIITRNGIGATSDFAQFFVTASAVPYEENIVPGAPTRYQEKITVYLYVIDALGKKEFGSTDINAHAVAVSKDKAYMQCLNSISPNDKNLAAFFRGISDKIIAYYDSQADNIIAVATSLAKGKKYEEALFRLSLVPEACQSYTRVVEAATGIYQKYIDHQSIASLMKAKAIWAAGQNAEAALEAAGYIAEVSPESSCWGETQALLEEIKTRVRKLDDEQLAWERKIVETAMSHSHAENMAMTDAWKSVGVAYGNHQQAHSYHDAYIMR